MFTYHRQRQERVLGFLPIRVTRPEKDPEALQRLFRRWMTAYIVAWAKRRGRVHERSRPPPIMCAGI